MLVAGMKLFATLLPVLTVTVNGIGKFMFCITLSMVLKMTMVIF